MDFSSFAVTLFLVPSLSGQMMPGLLASGGLPAVEGVGSQPGFPVTPLHSGATFTGFQQSKGNKYHVEVIFQVGREGREGREEELGGVGLMPNPTTDILYLHLALLFSISL